MPDFPCPVCGADNFRVLFPDTLGEKYPVFGYRFGREHSKTYRTVSCLDCGHAYATPRPADLWKSYQDVAEPEYLRFQSQRCETAKNVLDVIRRHKAGGRLLDVGCATGDFLSVAAGQFEAEGLELSGWASGIARQRGLTIHQELLENFKPARLYDVITLWGVIEHFERPTDEIRHIGRLLNPSGLVCVWTGDVESVSARVLGKFWWYKQGQHIQLFSRRSLRRAFEDNGYRHVTTGIYPLTTTFASIAQSIERYPVLRPIFRRLLTSPGLSGKKITLRLPGEMFSIFQKVPAGGEPRV